MRFFRERENWVRVHENKRQRLDDARRERDRALHELRATESAAGAVSSRWAHQMSSAEEGARRVRSLLATNEATLRHMAGTVSEEPVLHTTEIGDSDLDEDRGIDRRTRRMVHLQSELPLLETECSAVDERAAVQRSECYYTRRLGDVARHIAHVQSKTRSNTAELRRVRDQVRETWLSILINTAGSRDDITKTHPVPV